jgi:hypothetical protein
VCPSDLLHKAYTINFKLVINFKDKNSVEASLDFTLNKDTIVPESGFVEINLSNVIENKLKEFEQKDGKKPDNTVSTISWLI